jgi:hypothetical protein
MDLRERKNKNKLKVREFLQDTIDDAPYYPPVNGGVEFSNALPFPVELGPDASTSTTDIFELRLGDTSYDLN